MTNRVSDANSSTNNAARINAQRSRLAVLQERLTTGKRINRPSDDPAGAEMVLRLRTSQAEIEQFKRNTQSANQKITVADDVITTYEPILDRLRSIVTAGASDTSTQQQKNAWAIELDGLRERILTIANTRSGDEYVFGGTRQNQPPFNPTTGVPAANPTAPQYVQLEPNATAVPTGVTADKVFSDANSTIFNDLTAAAAALRGTGNPVADKATLLNTMDRLKIYADLAGTAHAKLGSYMNTTEAVSDKLGANFLNLDSQAENIEGADFVETAVEYSEAQKTFEAILQTTAKGRRSLFDFLG